MLSRLSPLKSLSAFTSLSSQRPLIAIVSVLSMLSLISRLSILSMLSLISFKSRFSRNLLDQAMTSGSSTTFAHPPEKFNTTIGVHRYHPRSQCTTKVVARGAMQRHFCGDGGIFGVVWANRGFGKATEEEGSQQSPSLAVRVAHAPPLHYRSDGTGLFLIILDVSTLHCSISKNLLHILGLLMVVLLFSAWAGQIGGLERPRGKKAINERLRRRRVWHTRHPSFPDLMVEVCF
ncbi:hypothetical protein Cgig2_025101 [Carnegiea gigantea]|uniref:Uncharacterized protein n=1 Tax=Carnegiea gigantea TaxID=171969 RepID=A0A9Q1KJI3_9CARY|nr:hypothetical protein Cgig2_025101 [Carnegiea gigantea]